tara:strand:- start:94 stop:759 length:666 start_codon:yes stop_codon:yes gene_type:complete
MDFIQASLIAERCQRNWNYDIPVKDQDIETLIQVAINMPTKQNVDYYELIVSTNKNFNKSCYDSAINPDDPYFESEPNKLRNGQVNAPLLFIWQNSLNGTETFDERCLVTRDIDGNNTGDYLDHSVDTAIGISSGATALAAAYLGYKTGFCACMDMPTLYRKNKETEFLKVSENLLKAHTTLFLGIGNPKDSMIRSDIEKDGEVFKFIGSYDKDINVKRIK